MSTLQGEGPTAAPARPTSLVGFDTVGNQTHQRDPEGRIITSTFDKADRLISSTAPAYTPPGGSAITPMIQHTYDTAGQRKTTTDPRGYVTSYDYDQLGRQVRLTDPAPDGQSAGSWVSEYDMAGEKLTSIDPTGARTQATYDDLGRQITATQIERKPATAAYVTTMEYDDAGRLVKQTVPGPGTGTKVTSFTYNAAGENTEMTDPAGTATIQYDLAGRLTKVIDANGNASSAEYDLAGRKTTAKNLNSTGTVLRTRSTGYDAAGNPISATSPEGRVTRQTFDALGRQTSLIEPVSANETITTSFGYDATGARTRITDGRGNATWTSYNSLGLVGTVTEPSTAAHPDAADRTWTHVYDAAGNQVASIQPGGVRTDRTFDHLGRLTTETGQGGGATTAQRTFGYDLASRRTTAGDLTVDYNDRGLPLKVSRGTVQETAYSYDALGNPTQRIDAAGTATFTYDTANRLRTATDPVTSRTLTYGYDPASRLETITATSGTASTQTIDYDNMDRVTGQTLRNGSGTQLAKITYGWDKDDNLTTKTTAGTAGAGTNTYVYDHAGRLTSWTAPGGAVTAYEWDAAGNRTKAGNATFTYDERNRLTSGDGTDYTYTPRGTLATSTKAGATTNYTFDAFNRLIADGDSLYSYDDTDRMASRIRGTARLTFAYSGLGNDLAAITDNGGAVQARYARDPGGGLLGLKEGTAAAAGALTDLHQDLVATYTTSLQTSTAYDPFGAVIAQTGTRMNLGYQGEYIDPDTGKVNMHARWYQPGTGTFTSRDTADLHPNPSVQANRYTYANASPLTGIDPSGHATADLGSTSAYYGELEERYYRNGTTGNRRGDGMCLTCTSNVILDPETARQVELDWEKKTWLGKDELVRLGYEYMPNGRPVDQPNFWFASEKVQNDYMSNWSPTMTDRQLAFSWVSVGGLKSIKAMERAAKVNPNDPRLAGFAVGAIKKKAGCGGCVVAGVSTSAGDPRHYFYNSYKQILKYSAYIDKAATRWKVDKNTLTAVLIYEMLDPEAQFSEWTGGLEAGALMARYGESGSYGISQLEAYKVKLVMKHYKNVDLTTLQAVRMLIEPSESIGLAAMYLRYLKDNIKVPVGDTGKRDRELTWPETAIAYCGCSGVTRVPSQYGVVINSRKFIVWVNTGIFTTKEPEEARRRAEFMQGGAGQSAAAEYWDCVRTRCGN